MTELLGTPSLAAAGLKQEELFPIREVSRVTGVNPVTLRAWERRYGLIQPTRTDSGHRLYSQADIETVQSILAWIERGVSVSKVGKILAREHGAPSTEQALRPEASNGEWSEWRMQLTRAVSSFDEMRLEQVYGQVFSTYPASVAFEQILMPVWQGLLQSPEEFGRTSEWLFLDAFLRARVLQRLQLARSQAPQRVLLAAIPGQCRELELLVAGLLLSGGEMAVSVLALGQPLEELTLICEKIRPHALVLFSNRLLGNESLRQLNRLALGLGCPLAIAGEAAELAEQGLFGSSIARLGQSGRLMQRRLQQFLRGHLDT